MSKSVYSEPRKAVAETLIQARRSAGLRQVELAERIGKDQTFISNIETGQRRVDVLEFYAIARAVGADPIELFSKAVADLPETIEV